jgi:hypothetical protein
MKRSIALLGLALVCSGALFMDERSQAMDFYIAYDRSLSMSHEGKAEDSKNWLIGSFIGQLVNPGDGVYFIDFYRNVETVWAGPVASAADKRELMRRISVLKPDGSYTDIGNALDGLKKLLEGNMGDGRMKYILLITDEIQEAPPESRYFSKDGSFSHAYLTYVKRETHGAWKAITIGVGMDAKIDESVKELSTVLTSLPADRLKNADRQILEGDPDANPAGENEGAGDGERPGGLLGALGKGPLLPVAAGALGLAVLALLAILLLKRLKSKQDDPGGKSGPENVAKPND